MAAGNWAGSRTTCRSALRSRKAHYLPILQAGGVGGKGGVPERNLGGYSVVVRPVSEPTGGTRMYMCSWPGYVPDCIRDSPCHTNSFILDCDMFRGEGAVRAVCLEAEDGAAAWTFTAYCFLSRPPTSHSTGCFGGANIACAVCISCLRCAHKHTALLAAFNKPFHTPGVGYRCRCSASQILTRRLVPFFLNSAKLSAPTSR